jgi:hypothetical protein
VLAVLACGVVTNVMEAKKKLAIRHKSGPVDIVLFEDEKPQR